jgi:predicted lactoylglutathione lyase
MTKQPTTLGAFSVNLAVKDLQASVVSPAMAKQPTTLGAFSVSLAVKDLQASQVFYEKLGFEQAGGDPSQNWLILRNGTVTIGCSRFPFLIHHPGFLAFKLIRPQAHERSRREQHRSRELHGGRSGQQSGRNRPTRAVRIPCADQGWRDTPIVATTVFQLLITRPSL